MRRYVNYAHARNRFEVSCKKFIETCGTIVSRVNIIYDGDKNFQSRLRNNGKEEQKSKKSTKQKLKEALDNYDQRQCSNNQLSLGKKEVAAIRFQKPRNNRNGKSKRRIRRSGTKGTKISFSFSPRIEIPGGDLAEADQPAVFFSSSRFIRSFNRPTEIEDGGRAICVIGSLEITRGNGHANAIEMETRPKHSRFIATLIRP